MYDTITYRICSLIRFPETRFSFFYCSLLLLLRDEVFNVINQNAESDPMSGKIFHDEATL